MLLPGLEYGDRAALVRYNPQLSPGNCINTQLLQSGA